MAKTKAKPRSRALVAPAPEKEAADLRRQQAFVLYRDMGEDRSLRKLEALLRAKGPVWRVSIPTLSTWSKEGEWQRRVIEHDLKESKKKQAIEARKQNPNQVGLDITPAEALRQAAKSALTSALTARLTVTKPSDLKSVVDTARVASELADKLEAQEQGTSTAEEIAAFGGRLLDQVIAARRKDFAYAAKLAAEAACAEAGTTNIEPVFRKALAALGLRLDEQGSVVDGELALGNAGSGAVPEPAGVDGVEVDAVSNEEDHGIAIELNDGSIVDVETMADEVADTAMDIDDVLRQLRGET